MTNVSNPTSSLSGLSSGPNIQSSALTSSTSDIISSFKEILSLMTVANSMSSSSSSPYQSDGTGTGMNMGDLMAPMMLLMLERLIEQQLEQNPSAAATGQTSSTESNITSTGASVGSKPVPSGRPVEGRITQEPHPGHMAFDIAVPVGTPVKTTMDGKVVHAGWNNEGYGNLVIVENGIYRTYYAHLSNIPVAVGDEVAAGSIVGLSGNTGNSTGPHLHYEIRKNKVTIDPTAATLQ